jgi:hypothetical protein
MRKQRFRRWNSEAGRSVGGSSEWLQPRSPSRVTLFMQPRMSHSTRSRAIRPITSRCTRGRHSGSWLADEILLTAGRLCQ